MTRKWVKPEPMEDIEPTAIGNGFYLSLSDYARKEGITRLTAHNRVDRGDLDVVRVGSKTVLVKVKKPT